LDFSDREGILGQICDFIGLLQHIVAVSQHVFITCTILNLYKMLINMIATFYPGKMVEAMKKGSNSRSTCWHYRFVFWISTQSD